MATSNSIHPSEQGNVKLIGIGGVVKGAKFSVRQGESVVIGRSRECDVCLRELPAVAELAERGEDAERHFHTVSRKHAKITYHEYGRVEIEDLSSNGTFVDGQRVEISIELEDLERHPHELRLGTSVVFQLDWWKLVPLSSIKMPKVKVKKKKDTELVEVSKDGDVEDAEEPLDPDDPTSSAHQLSDMVHEDTAERLASDMQAKQDGPEQETADHSDDED